MLKTQEPKYDVNQAGRIVNRISNNVIPDDEPIFIFRGRDRKAAEMILQYAKSCDNESHRLHVFVRYNDFIRFSKEHPERMKEPDTDDDGAFGI